MSVIAREPREAPASGPALNREVLDAFGALVKQLAATGQSIAASFRVAPSDLLALVKLDGVLTMKELAQRMGRHGPSADSALETASDSRDATVRSE